MTVQTIVNWIDTTSALQKRTYRAPHGKMYSIAEVKYQPNAAAGSWILFLDRPIGEETYDIFDGNSIIYAKTMNSLAYDGINLRPGYRTKHITVITTAVAAANGYYIIVYELVDATQAELIWEYLEKVEGHE